MKLTKLAWKIPVVALCTVVGLIIAVMVAVPIVLSPEKLTEWTRRYGSEYLVDGRVEVERVELTVWSTFPHATIEVDSLRVVNLAVPREYATVASVGSLKGHINLAALLIGRIDIGSAEIVRPCATLWSDSTRTSLSVLPPSEPDTAKSDGPLELPDLRIRHFSIAGNATVRYINETDSTDLSVTLHRSLLDGHHEAPRYTLTLNGNAHVPALLRSPLAFSADGAIDWAPAEPLAIGLEDFKIGVDSLMTQTSLKADFSSGIRIDELDFEVKPLPLRRVAALAADMPQSGDRVPAVESNAAFRLRAKLLKPYVYNPDTLLIPDMSVEASIADAPLKVKQWYLNLTNFGAEVRADISSGGLDRSTVELKRLNIEFPASNFTLRGSATNLASDPALKACFKGHINFTNLDRRIWPMLGMRLLGQLNADFDADTRLSYLSPNGFHNARLNGEATLRAFEALLPADSLRAGVTHARLQFGSSGSFNGADSLLMATVKVDSAWAEMPEMTVRFKELNLGAGVSNTESTADTTTVTPMGGRLTLKALNYKSHTDSTRALMRGLTGGVELRRFKGEAKAPEAGARIEVKRLVFADGVTRGSLRSVDIAATGYATPRKQHQHRALSHADSVRIAARRDSMLRSTQGYERFDPGIDRSSVALLKRWHLRGHLIAKGGRVMTPMFPLTTRLKGFDLHFNADSLMLNSMKVTAGHSDLSINGSITNIQRALGRRIATSPLRLRLNLESDSLNINQLTQAAFRGAAYMAKADSLRAPAAPADLEADDSQLQAEAEAEASTEMMAIVVPMNIDAEINVKARNITYSNMELKDFTGNILVGNGAANLRNLHAATDIGSVDLNMLYYAPTRSDVNFGLGLDLNRFNIGRVTEMMPVLDSIMPILGTLGGIIDVGISATTPVDSALNIKLPELRAMVRMSGDSLRVLDEQTFKTVSKWLLFHDKNKNLIDRMDVSMAVENNRLSLYPFMFDFDRYRIGVMGNNDMSLNLDYHVSILKSPIPFKFGINIKGNADKMKIRLGRARFKENMAAQTTELSDTIRLNLAREMRNVFNRGTKAARLGPLNIKRPAAEPSLTEEADTISGADSLYFINQGLIDRPETMAEPKE